MKSTEKIKTLLYRKEVLVSCIKSADTVPLKYDTKTLYLALTNISIIIFSESKIKTYIERYMLDEIEKIAIKNKGFGAILFIMTKYGKKRKMKFLGKSRKILKNEIMPKIEYFVNGKISTSELTTYIEIICNIKENITKKGKNLYGKIVGQDRVLSDKAIKAIEENINKEEKVLFCLVGNSNQTMIALEDRLLVIKTWLEAGETFGSKTTSFRYKDITSIEVNTGAINGVIEICTPSFQGTSQKDYLAISRDRNPFKVSNCLPFFKYDLKNFRPYLSYLEKKITSPEVSVDRFSQDVAEQDIATQLEKVTQLFKSGALSKKEFESSKKYVLGIN